MAGGGSPLLMTAGDLSKAARSSRCFPVFFSCVKFLNEQRIRSYNKKRLTSLSSVVVASVSAQKQR